MLDIDQHKFLMVQLLKEIYSDFQLSNNLVFKGGTALMFFHGLPRFSVDLDFNLLDKSMEKKVYTKIRKIAKKHGSIHDEAIKHFGIIVVVDYGIGERKLKIEISNRAFNDRSEIKSFMGISMNVMVPEDMFAHKLCALLDRSSITNRDIFDSWFFMQNRTPINASIIESRMGTTYNEYLQKCIDYLKNKHQGSLLQGVGELMDHETKTFVKNKLKTETITLLKFYKAFPILAP